MFPNRKRERMRRAKSRSYFCLSVFAEYGKVGMPSCKFMDSREFEICFPCLQAPFFSGMGVIKIKIKSKGNLFGQFAANKKKKGACPYKKLNW